jgi:hypothetical protein
MLARRREQVVEHEVDLASRIDPVARETCDGQRIRDRVARLGCLFPEEPRRCGDSLVDEAKDDLVLHAHRLPP